MIMIIIECWIGLLGVTQVSSLQFEVSNIPNWVVYKPGFYAEL